MDPFESEQRRLQKRASGQHTKFVYLDPDGTSPFLGVVIECESGVIYANQCAGTNNHERYSEGYFIPLGGAKVNPDDGPVDWTELTAPFHRGKSCSYGGTTVKRPSDFLDRLNEAVSAIPCWKTQLHGSGEDQREPLVVDETRLDEVCEAWVPVVTPNGPGVLLWSNCD